MIQLPIQDVLPWGLHRGVSLDLFPPRVCLQHCEHSSALACDVFVTFACNLSGRASAIERGSFRPVGFVRLQMQKWKSVRFVAGTGVSPVLEGGKSKPCNLTVHRHNSHKVSVFNLWMCFGIAVLLFSRSSPIFQGSPTSHNCPGG